MRIYRVGGSVRDELLGRAVQDRDYVVIDAREKDFLNLFPQAKKIGRDKPVFIYKGAEYTLSDQKDIYQNLWLRDLTVNSLAKGPEGDLIAIPNAREDLKNKVLRPVREENFFQDGLRVYRVARIAACFPEFKVQDSLFDLMSKLGKTSLLDKLAPERVGSEVRKACSCPAPGRFVHLICETGVLGPWFEELADLRTMTEKESFEPWESCIKYISDLMDKLAGDTLLVWMGFCYGLHRKNQAKQKFQFSEEKKYLTRSLGTRLRLPKKYIQAGEVAANYLYRVIFYPDISFEEKVDILLDLHKKDLTGKIFELLYIDRGKDFRAQADKDLKAILEVRLPEEYRNLGSYSGEILKKMRVDCLEQLYC